MSKNMSFGEAIWGILGAILLFLILKPVFRGMDTLLDTIIPPENEFLRMIAERIFFVIVLGSPFLIAFVVYLLQHRKGAKEAKEKESSWPALAASKHLTFVPGEFQFLGYGFSITGTYRHHHLKLDTLLKSQGWR